MFEFSESPAVFGEAMTLAFLKFGGGVELFFSYNNISVLNKI